MATQYTEPTSDQFANSLIRVPDLDIAIYRIIPLWFFEEALRLKQLVLVSPRNWEDPYEIIGEPIAVNYPAGNQVIINQSLPPVFAQCWSATTQSDTLLRAYSRVIKDPHFRRNICPRHEGVSVKSTPRKLLAALVSGTAPTREGNWFLGSVQYLPQDALLQEIANAIHQNGVDVFSTPSNRARLLLLKRDAFCHEAELRALFVQRDATPAESILRVSIDPLAVFEEVSFDPRLELFERKERETVVRRLGFTGAVTESGLYDGTLLEVMVNQETDGSSPDRE